MPKGEATSAAKLMSDMQAAGHAFLKGVPICLSKTHDTHGLVLVIAIVKGSLPASSLQKGPQTECHDQLLVPKGCCTVFVTAAIQDLMPSCPLKTHMSVLALAPEMRFHHRCHLHLQKIKPIVYTVHVRGSACS